MKVFFTGPMKKTYHPKLGELVKDKAFDLSAEEAAPYIKAGLLKKKTGKK